MNGLKGSSLVRVTLLGHEMEHVNTLELGLSGLFEIGFWADVLNIQFDFKRHFHTRMETRQAQESYEVIKMHILSFNFWYLLYVYKFMLLLLLFGKDKQLTKGWSSILMVVMSGFKTHFTALGSGSKLK